MEDKDIVLIGMPEVEVYKWDMIVVDTKFSSLIVSAEYKQTVTQPSR